MTLEEAKEFYFQYYGHSFHMDREEPLKYQSFTQFSLGKETLRMWDEELLEDLFKNLWQQPGHVWNRHGEILKIIRRNHCDATKYLERLLDEMKKMNDLDLFELTLVIENMAGRTESMKDGGAYVFHRYSKLSERMNEIMERLIEANQADLEGNQRYREAVFRYRRAYDKWHVSVE